MRPALITLLLLATVACNQPPPEAPQPTSPPPPVPSEVDNGNPQTCVDHFDPERDYFPHKVTFRHAEGLAVEYHRHYKLVTVDRPWPGAERALRTLLLQCGTPRPPGYDDAEMIEIPAKTVLTTSTTELPHIVGLGLVDRLLGHDKLDYVSSIEIRRRIDAGQLIEIGSGPLLRFELVVEADPGLLLADSLGESGLDHLDRLRRAGVPVALAPSFLETSPLGRAEWIQHTALYFNREARAAEIFGRVEERYAELAATVRRALGEGDRPTVVTGGPIGDTWWMPGGRSYLALLLADAGGRYLWASDPTTGSLPLDLESVYERALDADVWLQPGSWGSLEEIRAVDRRLADFAAFREGRVWNYDARLNPRGGNDYWETGTARPDLVLADLVKIFHPELLPDHQLTFHRRLDWRLD